jgi:phospholipid/cholesterol/gamma-HCH transport system substrate-binding protein
MKTTRRRRGVHPAWWALSLFAVIGLIVWVCTSMFAGSFNTYVPVTLTSDRTGLVMEPGAQVKLRGVEVGRVASVTGGASTTKLKLEMFPGQIRHIPANVRADIKATTVFGAKYVDLTLPDKPSPNRLAGGAVLWSDNVSTEVNATLTALADGVRGQGPRMGEATTDANQVLLALNPRMGTIRQNWRSFKGFSDAYAGAAQNILATLDAASTTSATITNHAKDLDALLLSVIGFSTSGVQLLAPNRDNLVNAINGLQPTTDLLLTYNPEYTCLLVGAKFYLDHGGYATTGGNGRSSVVDAALLLGDDPYQYPQNLPIVAAKGGPGGAPGCGSLPDVAKNFPVRYAVTDTGWGTGVDLRPNPGIGHPCWADYFPVTRGTPKPPSIRQCIPGPAPGPIPYAGAPPYGASLYGPGGAPLWPGVPPPPAPGPAPAPSSPPAP